MGLSKARRRLALAVSSIQVVKLELEHVADLQ